MFHKPLVDNMMFFVSIIINFIFFLFIFICLVEQFQNHGTLFPIIF